MASAGCYVCARETPKWLCYDCAFCLASWIMLLFLTLIALPQFLRGAW